MWCATRTPTAALFAALALSTWGVACKRPVVGRDFAGASITELTVEPENVRQGVPVSLRFRLDGGPQGAVDYSIGPRSFQCSPTRLADGRFECVHEGVSRQDYPQGGVDVVVRAKDRVGKESSATARVTLDFDCPQFTRLDIDPPIGGPGRTAVVTIESNELLGSPPIVSRGGMLWETAIGSGTTYTVNHPITEMDDASGAEVIVRIVDLAGNTSGDCGIDGRLDFGVDRESPVVNPPLVEIRRDIPGQPTKITAQMGAFTDDVDVKEVRVLESDATGEHIFAVIQPRDDGSIPETALGGAAPSGRVRVQAVDVAGNESPAVPVIERWRLSVGMGEARDAAIRTAVRYTPAPPRSPSMDNRTRELATDLFAEDTESAQVEAHVGFRAVGSLPAGYRDTGFIAAGYDPESRAIVAFGGRVRGIEDQRDETLILRWNQTSHEYDNTVILASPGNTPVSRIGVNIAFDDSGCGIMFGGERIDRWLNDTWRVCASGDGYVWRQLQTINSPEPRYTPILWDRNLRRYAISSGWSRFSAADFWYLDPPANPNDPNAPWRWVPVTPLPDGLADTDRLFHAFYWEERYQGYGLALGIAIPLYLDGFWAFSGGNWTRSTLPFELYDRTGFGFAYDDARSMLAVWGDDRNEEQIADFDPDTWLLAGDPRNGAQSWRRTNLSPSVARGAPTLVYDRDRETVIVFGGIRFIDLASVPPIVEEMITSPSFPYLQASLDLDTARPTGIAQLHLDIRATGSGDGDGVGPGTNRAGGVSVLLYDHELLRWDEVEIIDTPLTGGPIDIPVDIADNPERYVSYDGVVPVTLVTRWPATEDADARLEVDLVDGDLILSPAVQGGAHIDLFRVDPSQLQSGRTATISWSVSNAPEGIELRAAGALIFTSSTAAGSIPASPTATTRYELRAKNAAEGDATSERTLTVDRLASPPLVIGFNAARRAGPRGGTVRLSWQTERANLVRVLRGRSEILSTASMVASGAFEALLPLDPTATSTSFVLEARSDAGTERREVVVLLANGTVVRGPGASRNFTGESISPAGEQDLYVVEMTAPGYIDATIFVPSSPGCTLGVDTTLTLLDSNLDSLVYDDDDGPEACSHIDRIQDSRALVTPGTYYLLAQEYGDDTAIPTYMLQVQTFAVQCGNGVIEPGEACDDSNTVSGDGCTSTCAFETIATYTVPTDGRVVFDDAITPAGAVRVFEIDVVSRAFVTAETFAPNVAGGCPSADTFISLLASDMTTVIDDDDDDGSGYCSFIGALLDPGTYYLAVHELNDDGTIPAYQLVFDVQAMLIFEAEPNDTPAEATSFGTVPAATLTAPRSAAIQPAGDDDYFSFTLAAPGTVTISTYSSLSDRTVCSGVDTTMTLYDSSQVELAFTDDDLGPCSVLDGINGTDPALVNMAAGTYWVLIRDYQDDDPIASYFIDVEVQ